MTTTLEKPNLAPDDSWLDTLGIDHDGNSISTVPLNTVLEKLSETTPDTSTEEAMRIHSHAFGRQVTVERSSGKIEDGWSVMQIRTGEEDEPPFVKVAKELGDGRVMYKDVPVSKLLESQKPSSSEQEDTSTKYDTEDQELPFEKAPETLATTPEVSAEKAPEQPESLSPTGAALEHAAQRINAALERRVTSKAHGEALKEDKARATESQEAAFATYEENIADTLSEDEAYSMNDKFDAKAARHEKLEEAKNKVRGFGRRALRFLKNAGLLAVGAGALAGEYAAKKAKDGTEAVKEGATFAKDTVKLNVEAAAAVVGYEVGQKVDAVKEGVQNRVEAVKTKVADTREMAGDMVDSVREGLRRRKEAALTRKYERHAKWMSFKKGMKEYTSSVKEGFGETKDALKERAEKVKQNIRITKSAGRAALLTFRDHREAFKQ